MDVALVLGILLSRGSNDSRVKIHLLPVTAFTATSTGTLDSRNLLEGH